MLKWLGRCRLLYKSWLWMNELFQHKLYKTVSMLKWKERMLFLWTWSLPDLGRKEEGTSPITELYDRDPSISRSRLIRSKQEAHKERRLCDTFWRHLKATRERCKNREKRDKGDKGGIKKKYPIHKYYGWINSRARHSTSTMAPIMRSHFPREGFGWRQWSGVPQPKIEVIE